MSIQTAMVLAAGLGTRMRPLTDDRPKALVTVGGRALIDHMLDRLLSAGVRRAVVNVHAFADRLQDHLQARHDLDIIISDERGALLETGGGVLKALPDLGDGPFLCANIDSLWLEDGRAAIPALIQAYDPARMDALLLLADRATSTGYDGAGDFAMDGETIGPIRFRQADQVPYVYTGVQILHPRLFAGHDVGRGSLHPFWQAAAQAGRLHGQRLSGQWMHVGDPQARSEAEARWLARSDAS